MHPKLFKDTMYVTAYNLACQGSTNKDIAGALGVTINGLQKWIERNPAFKDAIDRGQKRFQEVTCTDGDKNSFKNYVYKHLPPKLRALWEQLKDLSLKKRFRKKKYLLDMETEEVQKHLFIYALCAKNFNISRACKSIAISWKKYEKWITDKDFKELLDQIEIHRNNFYEEALVKKVKEGDTSAILFVNRTRNRERGYGDKQEVEVSGKIQHEHSHLIKIDELPLSMDVKKAILAAIREKKEGEKKLTYEAKDDLKVLNGTGVVKIIKEEED